MRKFLIERRIPGVEQLDSCGLSEAAHKSNCALADLAPRAQWIESYVVDGGTVCVYLADDEHVDRDTVFGVSRSLVVRPSEGTPDSPRPDLPGIRYGFRLSRSTASGEAVSR